MKFLKTEVHSPKLYKCLNPTVSAKIPFTWSKQHLPCYILKTKYDNGYNPCNSKDTEKHLAEHLKMFAKCKQFITLG